MVSIKPFSVLSPQSSALVKHALDKLIVVAISLFQLTLAHALIWVEFGAVQNIFRYDSVTIFLAAVEFDLLFLRQCVVKR